MAQPKFTIITPTYNRELLLQRTVRSIMAQTFRDWELFVMDDGSTDNTEGVMQQFLTDSRIKYYKKPNTGAADSRNIGASYATGDHITFLDSDDEALPRWLETISSLVDAETGIACAGCYTKFPDGTTGQILPPEINVYGEKKKLMFTCGSLFIKRSVFLDIKGYDTTMPTGLQSELGYRILAHLRHSNLKIVSIDQCLVVLHVHEGERMRTDWKNLARDAERFVNKFYSYFHEWDKRELANNYAVIAYYNYMLKQRKKSLSYLMKAIRLKPFLVKNYLRIIKYGFV